MTSNAVDDSEDDDSDIFEYAAKSPHADLTLFDVLKLGALNVLTWMVSWSTPSNNDVDMS